MSKQIKKVVIKKAKAKKAGKKPEIIQDFKFKTNKKNQFIAFFKPETFINKEIKHIEKILDLAFDKFNEFKVEIAGAAYFPGTAIAKYSIMDRHYGVINKLSKNASKILTKEEKENLFNTLGIKNKKTKILGGHEAHPLSGMSVEEFDKYWLSIPSTKIKSGFYAKPMMIAKEEVIVINGFHPQQLAHFTGSSRSLVLMLINSDSSWQVIRDEMLGGTFPEEANPNSIRGSLFKSPKDYGFEKVAIENNVMHISAGPTEAIFEMDNFLKEPFGLDITKEGALLASKLKEEGLSEEGIRELMTNKDLHSELEHKDTEEAIKVIKEKKKSRS